MRSPGERSIWKAVNDKSTNDVKYIRVRRGSQYRLNVTFDLLAHESISSPGTDRIVDGGVTSFTRFSIVASEF